MSALMEEVPVVAELGFNHPHDIYCGDIKVGTFVIAMECDGVKFAAGQFESLPVNTYPLVVEQLLCGLRGPLSRRDPSGKTDASEARTIGYGDASVTVEVKVRLEVGVNVRLVRRVIRGVVEALLAHVEQRATFDGNSRLDLSSLGLTRGPQVGTEPEHIYAVASTGGGGCFAVTCDGDERSTEMGDRF